MHLILKEYCRWKLNRAKGIIKRINLSIYVKSREKKVDLFIKREIHHHHSTIHIYTACAFTVIPLLLGSEHVKIL